MPDLKQSTLLPILLRTKNSTGYCVTILLAWAMLSDGYIDDNEMAFLQKIAEPLGPEAIPTILDALKKGDYIDIQLACELLKDTFDRNEQLHFLELIILMTVADGYLNFAEMQIIGFVADLFGISASQVKATYKEITGREMPPLADASSKAWWDSVSSKSKSKSSSSNRNSNGYSSGTRSNGHANITRIKALAVLGLDEDANQDDIKSAYRRMAQVHHPDKFHSLGEEAVKAAEQSFSRIQVAYDYLRA